MPVHFYDPHYGRWPCTQAFDCSLPALATAHDAVSQKSADFSHPSSVSSSLTWGTPRSAVVEIAAGPTLFLYTGLSSFPDRSACSVGFCSQNVATTLTHS